MINGTDRWHHVLGDSVMSDLVDERDVRLAPLGSETAETKCSSFG